METIMKYMVTRDILKVFTLTDPVVLNTHLADIEDILKASMLVRVAGNMCVQRKYAFHGGCRAGSCVRVFIRMCPSQDDRRVNSGIQGKAQEVHGTCSHLRIFKIFFL